MVKREEDLEEYQKLDLFDKPVESSATTGDENSVIQSMIPGLDPED